MISAAHIANLEGFLAGALGCESGLRIENLARIHGGASRETYSFDAVAPGKRIGLILRRDPSDSLIDTERALEFAAYRSVEGAPAPAPRAMALVTDEAVIGAPFFVMERIEKAQTGSPFNPAPFGAHGAAIGRDMFRVLGHIGAIDPGASALAAVVDTPAPDACWRRELDHWEKVIAESALEPQPIAMAAIRRLRANPPAPPERLSIVHGDFRIGNFLHDGEGHITGVLDWEMAHIGDAHEDIGWALDPLWWPGAGLIPFEEAVREWEAASGQRFDPARYRWWSLFNSLKALGIWISAGRTFDTGKNADPVIAFSSWFCLARHNQILARRLAAAPRGAIA
jgi:aminoglycoside phosphotransferase (APT) family kinase protein